MCATFESLQTLARFTCQTGNVLYLSFVRRTCTHLRDQPLSIRQHEAQQRTHHGGLAGTHDHLVAAALVVLQAAHNALHQRHL